MSEKDPVLDLKMSQNDADAKTVREYLGALLRAVWEKGEGFSGKRPFGNSGWQLDLYATLIAEGVVGGELDFDGLVETCDKAKAKAVISEAIERLVKGGE